MVQVAVTQPMAFDYEISAAILFMLEEEYTELIVDIPRGEDSLFFSGQNIMAVGEAKNVTRKPWTLKSLFHSGTQIGAILQLWIRRKEGAKSVIFSSVGTSFPTRLEIISRFFVSISTVPAPTVPNPIIPTLIPDIRTSQVKIQAHTRTWL